ncbi:hypothetical protein [uncultured Bacteroides sp.]|uniref:MutS family DNA mismatch repair protein n=1 Tax=uncultured Bacteroides sp. TaxID=162156 RepID=UPI002AAB98CB|nr:hypothetical protein [uncultured Bacteroides sp.]
MKETTAAESFYSKNIEKIKNKIHNNKKRIYIISITRIILFTLGLISGIYFWNVGGVLLATVIIIPLFFFSLLIKKHNALYLEKDYLETILKVNKQEMQAIHGDISSFEDGSEFIDATHHYSFDLDLFGKQSLFQCVNRTATEVGKRTLAKWFMKHLQNKQEIENRQEAVKELAPRREFRQRFRTLGLLHKGEFANKEEIIQWAQTSSYFENKKVYRILPILIFTINVILISLSVFKLIPYSIPEIAFVFFIFLSFIFSKRITQIQNIYGKKLQILGTYATLTKEIEETDLQCSSLKYIKSLVQNNKDKSSSAIKKLNELMNELDRRNNIIIAMLLNGLFFWELRQMMKIEIWRKKHALDMPNWLKAIAKMDAYCSLGTFAYNHPEYIYPAILDSAKQTYIEGKQFGHPLMNIDKCVKNDLLIEKRPLFIIVTGANMAGKSTYLRTIGVNYLLACIGSPVCASEMKIFPAKLITDLHTSDSLVENESYFFSELKRLKLIIDELKGNEELFIILDEILKGTNSIDKQKGSIALIKQFIELKTNGIIATHDLALSSLQDIFPDNIRNFCFEAEIINDELDFSYEMKEGIVQNMNACFLMKKMGIAIIENSSTNN